MKHNEILAAIHQMKEQLANCQCQIAVLEELLTKESVSENPIGETPVIEEEVIVEKSTTLPDPPKEIIIDMLEDNTPDEECILGCKIINKLGDFYNGKCSVVRLHKQYFDNGYPKLYINKYKVVVIALDDSLQEIGRIVTHWDNLSEFHTELSRRGINTHNKETWMPKVINLDLD